ncbi:MAG: glutathione S-transferase family protein [bacterium]|nr:glutathione S-transferase family protein [bacterium]
MREPATNEVTLYEFSLSHYNEKARWALDYKGVDYHSNPVLPGFHAGILRKLSGQKMTPVVVIGEEVVAGSAAIVERIDAMRAERPLFPDEPGARGEVEEWITWLDEEVGPPLRLALFHALLPQPLFAATFFSQEVSATKRTLYRAAFPAIALVLKRLLDVTDENAAAARPFVDRALTRVADAAAETGYLVGDRFTAADLTAGALFFPLFYPDEIPTRVPDRQTPIFRAWLDQWRDHEGAGYVRTLYAKHRRRS